MQLHHQQNIAVYMSGHYIQYNIPKMMRKMCFEEKAKDKISKLNKWNSTTFEDISWSEHAKAISTKYNEKKTTTKIHT